MKVLKVIHGYPYLYNAGSEVYSQILCHELVRQGHEIIVFTRQENAYKQEYSIEWTLDASCTNIRLCLINMSHSKDAYRHHAVDEAFIQLLNEEKPDVIHIGHLNHLSTSLVAEAHLREYPLLFTLHDFWLMCPRGQFLQSINSKNADLYPTCDFQENEKCAKQCYWRYFGSQDNKEDIQYWTNWVGRRMDHIREIASYIDLFIAPSRYLMDRFINDFLIDKSKMVYLDYGFQRKRLEGRNRYPEKDFTFGYIGTHKQAKGILHLIEAFSKSYHNAQLKIWGSPLQPFTHSLESYVNTLNSEISQKIHWMGNYRNEQIIADVFNHVDAIVVPSIWGENSPLVIHEALEAGIPVITANYGGMREYVHHEINGLLFQHRNPESLAEQMKRLKNDPLLASKLAKKGYLQSTDHHIPDIQEHVEKIVELYQLATARRRQLHARKTRSMAYHL